MAAQVVKRLPEGDDWTYELKFDGYRALIIKGEQRVELRSTKNKDLTGMYRGIADIREGRLRHAAFLGLRSDKNAREVRRECGGIMRRMIPHRCADDTSHPMKPRWSAPTT